MLELLAGDELECAAMVGNAPGLRRLIAIGEGKDDTAVAMATADVLATSRRRSYP